MGSTLMNGFGTGAIKLGGAPAANATAAQRDAALLPCRALIMEQLATGAQFSRPTLVALKYVCAARQGLDTLAGKEADPTTCESLGFSIDPQLLNATDVPPADPAASGALAELGSANREAPPAMEAAAPAGNGVAALGVGAQLLLSFAAGAVALFAAMQ